VHFASEHSDWIDAALVSCQDALDFARAHGEYESFRAQVRRVRGVEVDMLAEDVRIVAFTAAWDTLSGGTRPQTLDFHNQRWLVQLPPAATP